MYSKNLKKKIGIIGGGQLGKMMILDGKRLGLYFVILDPTPACPAHSIADEHIIKRFDDKKALDELATKVDVITYEFEHIEANYLSEMEDRGIEIYPSPKALLKIQDKFVQNQELVAHHIPTPAFAEVSSIQQIENFIAKNGYKGMLKSRLGGYDGKGNACIMSKEDIPRAFESLGKEKANLMIEEFIPFEKEISILACRGKKGEITVYPVGENIHKNSILDVTIVPARVSEEAVQKAMAIAEDVMRAFEGVGMFCVELFVTKDEEVLVNEVAPRPHNSGHYTIEGCCTSQFEQHIRAITGLPLTKNTLRQNTVMFNLLGKPGYEGAAVVLGLEDVCGDEAVKIHIYGKEETKPYRKMGHGVVIGEENDTIEDMLKKAEEVKSKVVFLTKE